MLDSIIQTTKGPSVTTDKSRDAKLTDFGKATLSDRYLLPGEDFQDLFARVASTYGDEDAHAQRIYDYLSNHWFMAATPVLSNGGADRGCPSRAFSTRAVIAWTVSWASGQKMCGSRQAGVALAAIGAISAP